MIPKLSVPDLSSHSATAIEIRPAKVEKWLAELPILKPDDTSRRVYIALMTLNRLELDNKTRFKLMELYRGPIKRLAVELQKEYVGRPLPLFSNNKMQAEQNRRIHEELATGYKHIVLNLVYSGKIKADGKPDSFLATAIERAITSLTEVLVKSYLCYSETPAGIWQEIHQLYLFAEYSGNAGVEVKDPHNTAMVMTSVTNRYKQALLVGLSNPYHLSVHVVEKVNHYLDRWALLAQLGQAKQINEGFCQFLIDQHYDDAGKLFFSDIIIEDCNQCRALYTQELVKHIHTQLTDLQAGNEPKADGLEAGFYNGTVESLLIPLINAWGVNPKRQFPRKHAPDTRLDVAIGIKPVNYSLNGGYILVPSSQFVAPMPQRTSIGKQPEIHKQDPNIIISKWQVSDESASGIALINKDVKNDKIRVGELSAYKPSNKKHGWEIGVIRWMKSVSDTDIEIGIQRLAPKAKPIVIKLISEDGRESDFLPAIILPEITAMKQQQSLIIHKGIFKQGRELYVDDGASLRKIQATKLLEETPIFSRFEYDYIMS